MCTWESEKVETEAFCRKLVAAAGKDDEGGRNHHLVSSYYEDGDEKGTLLCVTSGVSYVGLALVNHLLQLGYSLRITVENPGKLFINFRFLFHKHFDSTMNTSKIELKTQKKCFFFVHEGW